MLIVTSNLLIALSINNRSEFLFIDFNIMNYIKYNSAGDRREDDSEFLFIDFNIMNYIKYNSAGDRREDDSELYQM